MAANTVGSVAAVEVVGGMAVGSDVEGQARAALVVVPAGVWWQRRRAHGTAGKAAPKHASRCLVCMSGTGRRVFAEPVHKR